MMTADEDRRSFRSALSKGLGRALQSVRATGTLIDEEAVLDACLHNRCFDPQLEGSRATWLIEILSAGAVIDRFQGPILLALSMSSDIWVIDQLCGFAEFYADRGVQGARVRLYRTLDEQPDRAAPWLAEEQIVRLDGIDGFLRIAARRGAAILRGEDIGDLAFLADDVEKTFGADVVATALTSAAASNPDIRAYHERLREARLQASSRPSVKRSDHLRATTLDQVLAAIDGRDHSVTAADLGGWGRYASAESVRRVASRMFEEHDPVKIAKYLRVFYRVPLPEFDERLINLLDHADGEVRR